MNNYNSTENFTEIEQANDSQTWAYDSAPAFEPARFQDEYESFEFESMAEVPNALAAFVSYQQSFDL
ncbi:MAG: hypothetical protein COA96_03255 [SAR86 cluster bacterium]|uniref:Uncharacterized protein n=1 Tax=SAR86 cluster bacterium TaxID=2030880 RepID=A0A2A5B875_9GAMM|nr:MAG: hypothetical protein COA96_03255 [SAR86 cluster bacterium]